jgi:hypothetical protein
MVNRFGKLNGFFDDHFESFWEVPIPMNSATQSERNRPVVPIESGHLRVGAKRRWG